MANCTSACLLADTSSICPWRSRSRVSACCVTTRTERTACSTPTCWIVLLDSLCVHTLTHTRSLSVLTFKETKSRFNTNKANRKLSGFQEEGVASATELHRKSDPGAEPMLKAVLKDFRMDARCSTNPDTSSQPPYAVVPDVNTDIASLNT